MAVNADKPGRASLARAELFEKSAWLEALGPLPLSGDGRAAGAWQPSTEAILSSISDVVEVIDTKGVIVYSNISGLRQRKLGLDTVVNRKCHQVYDKVCSSCCTCPLDEVFGSGGRLIRECPVSSGGSGGKWVRQHLYPMRDRAGSLSGVLRLVFDITGEKRAQVREEEYLNTLEQSLHNREQPQLTPAQALSPRELEVLGYLVDGMSNQEIARLLGLSPNTIKTHVSHIFNKLGVNHRAQAAVAAVRLKLV